MFDWCVCDEEKPVQAVQVETRQSNEQAVFDWCAGSEEELIHAVRGETRQ